MTVRLVLFVLMLLCLVAAVPVPDPAADPAGFAAALAALWGQWWLFGATFAVGATKLLRSYGSGWIPFFSTRTGGVVLAVITGSIGAVGSALLAGEAPGWGLIGHAILAAVGAIGTHSAAKNLHQDHREHWDAKLTQADRT